MTRAEDLVKQASAAGLKPAIDFFVTPGSEQIRATLERDTTLSTFEEAGGIVLANACGVSQIPPLNRWEQQPVVVSDCPIRFACLANFSVAMHWSVETHRWSLKGRQQCNLHLIQPKLPRPKRRQPRNHELPCLS